MISSNEYLAIARCIQSATSLHESKLRRYQRNSLDDSRAREQGVALRAIRLLGIRIAETLDEQNLMFDKAKWNDAIAGIEADDPAPLEDDEPAPLAPEFFEPYDPSPPIPYSLSQQAVTDEVIRLQEEFLTQELEAAAEPSPSLTTNSSNADVEFRASNGVTLYHSALSSIAMGNWAWHGPNEPCAQCDAAREYQDRLLNA